MKYGSSTRWALTCAAVFVAASIARADIVFLKDGKKVEGKITHKDDAQITLVTKLGPMTLKTADIDHIEAGRTPEEEVAYRVDQAKGDAAKLWDAAMYAREKKLTKQFKEIAASVVKADPNHKEANQALGNIEENGKWYTPADYEKAQAKYAAQMKAEGKEFIEGLWMPHDKAQIYRGYEKDPETGEFLQPVEIYRKKWAKLTKPLLGIELQTKESEHFVLRSNLPEDTQANILSVLEACTMHFYDLFKLNAKEHRVMDGSPFIGRPTAVYVLPDIGVVPKFVETGGYMEQIYNTPKGVNERYTTDNSFPVFFPSPLIVTSLGAHLISGQEVSLNGYLTNLEGNMLIRRFKRGGKVPGWVEAGITYYFEARFNNYATLTLAEFAGYENVHPIDDSLLSFQAWYQRAADPQFRATLPTYESMRKHPIEELDAVSIVKSYFLVRWLLDTDTDRFVDYVRKAYEQNTDVRPIKETSEEQAFKEVFKMTADEFDAKFLDWLAKNPPVPAPF